MGETDYFLYFYTCILIFFLRGMNDSANIACKKTVPLCLTQEEIWRIPCLTPVLHRAKFRTLLTLPYCLTSFTLASTVLQPQMLKKDKSSRKRIMNTVNPQTQFIIIFNLPFVFWVFWIHSILIFKTFSTAIRDKNFFSYKMWVVIFFSFNIITKLL